MGESHGTREYLQIFMAIYGADVISIHLERNLCRDIVTYHVKSCTNRSCLQSTRNAFINIVQEMVWADTQGWLKG